MSRLEEIKDILNSPGEVFFGSISDEGVVSQDVVDAEPYFKWLIEEIDNQAQKAEELQAKVDELEADKKRLEDLVRYNNLPAMNSMYKEIEQYRQALEDIRNKAKEDYFKTDIYIIASEALKGVEG
ncbi:hypothetical protein [Oceanobacillus kimchii]|uniref:hypothetical protein n=1 Tax=Oceanobacillus kimchii TaxID=746691 RepID=UPI003B013FBE